MSDMLTIRSKLEAALTAEGWEIDSAGQMLNETSADFIARFGDREIAVNIAEIELDIFPDLGPDAPSATDAPIKIGEATPWGKAQHITEYRREMIDGHVEGVWNVETDRHEGYYVSPYFNEQIPLKVRYGTFNEQGVTGWYEEDCDGIIVARKFLGMRD